MESNSRKFPRWHYDEMRQVGTDYGDLAQVVEYDQRMAGVRDLSGEIEDIVAALEIHLDQDIVEIGCGTGEVSVALAPLCRTLHAVAVSQVMIEFAKRKVEQRAVGNITFEHAGFLTSRFPEGRADAVVSQLALHHLPEFWKQVAMQRVFAMLKPGGRFYLHDMVFSFDPSAYAHFFPDLIDRVRDLAGDFLADDMALGLKEEFYSFDITMEAFLRRAGFQIERATYRDGFLAWYVCRKPDD